MTRRPAGSDWDSIFHGSWWSSMGARSESKARWEWAPYLRWSCRSVPRRIFCGSRLNFRSALLKRVQNERTLRAGLPIILPDNFDVLNMGRDLLARMIDVDDAGFVDTHPGAIEVSAILAWVIKHDARCEAGFNDSLARSA